jgi:N-sulfoglucosamine sulfohydrolase
MIRPALLILSILGSSPVAFAEPNKPNLVLFLADDLGYADCSPFGGKDIPTPNMERLAREGMKFTQAFVASPSCAPSRAALLTGLDPMRNGAMINHSRPKAELKKWPAYFQELGYEVVAIGKVAHYAQVTEYGFDHVSHFKYHEDECIDEAIKWLQNRNSTKPLCLLVGTNWSHVPWPAEPKGNSEQLPPKMVDTKESHHARGRYLAAVSNADRDLGKVYEAAQKYLGKDLFFAFTSDHGSQFPFGKWNCYDAGVHTPLIVSWPGKVKPGTTSKAMVSWIDLLPTMISATDSKPPVEISGQSFLEVLLGKHDRHRDKVFLTHSSDGKMNRYPIRAVRTPEWKYIRNLDPNSPHQTHVDQGNAKADGRNYWDSWVEKAKTDPKAAELVKKYHTRPAEELYDIINDPWELNNLAADPAQAERVKKLGADLDGWMKSTGDRGMETEKTFPLPKAKQKQKQKE